MNVATTTGSPFATDADTIAIGVFEDESVAQDLPGRPLEALLDSGEAKPTFKHLAHIHADGKRVVLAGLGHRSQFDGERARIIAALVGRRVRELSSRGLVWELPPSAGDEIVDGLIGGTVLGAYRFTRFRSGEPEPTLTSVTICADHDVAAAADRAAVLAAAQNRARELGNRPANDLTPTALADYAVARAAEHAALTVTVLGEDELRELGMGALLAVSRGSPQPAWLIALAYEGGPAPGKGPRLGLIGKAVTYDTGGLSLKTATGMLDMKFDMAGGAAVIEAIGALARLRAPVRVLGIVGATENAVSGDSIRPGDIVTAMDGTTIEINNTDAEGRLVLGDCVTYARRQGVDAIVDIATLTGGVVIALGSAYAGLMANDDRLAARLIECGQRTGELLWRLPLHPAYAEMIRGRYARLTNRTQRREASAITGAEFIHHFAGDVPWAHLDIAAVGDDGRTGGRDYLDKGGTGFGVRLLAELALGFGDADADAAASSGAGVRP